MKGKNRPGREQKKKPGIFGEKKKRNKAKRQYIVAAMLGGPDWANKCVEDGKIDGSLLPFRLANEGSDNAQPSETGA
jgi:hypothetical protein